MIPKVQIKAQKIGTRTTGIANQFLWKISINPMTIPRDIGNIVSRSSYNLAVTSCNTTTNPVWVIWVQSSGLGQYRSSMCRCISAIISSCTSSLFSSCALSANRITAVSRIPSLFVSIAKFWSAEEVPSKIWSTLCWSLGIAYVPVSFTASSSASSMLRPPNIFPSLASKKRAFVELNSFMSVEILKVNIILSFSPRSA